MRRTFRMVCGIVVSLSLAVLLHGCGGGSGGSGSSGGGGSSSGNSTIRPKTVLAGTISTAVKGLELTLVMPVGVSVKADASGSVSSGVITLLSPNDGGSYSAAKYTPATRSVSISTIRGTAPFSPGNFFDISCDVEAGISTQGMVFTIDRVRAFDALGAEIIPAPTATAGI